MKQDLTVASLKAQTKQSEARIAEFVRKELDLFYSETGMQVGSIDVQLLDIKGFDGQVQGVLVNGVNLGVIL